MANSGSFSGSVHDGHYKVQVNWSASQSVANNTSTITATIYLINDWSLSIGGRSASQNWIVINGTTYNFSTSAINTTGTHTLATITSNAISHNNDGTKSISMSVSFAMNATISGTYHGNITGSTTVTLNTDRKSVV